MSVSPDSAEVEVSQTLNIDATICAPGGDSLEWYVNYIPGGNPDFGTITQTNPAIYTAPSSVPDPPTVSVMAVYSLDPSKADGCAVTIRFTKIHVDVALGDDDQGTGSVAKPLRTITRSLEMAQSGMTVHVKNGIYSEAIGEEFPITLVDGIALVGEDWNHTVLSPEPGAVSLNEAIVMIIGIDCVFRRFLIDQHIGAAGTSVAVTSTASGARIDSIGIPEAEGVAMRVEGAANTLIENCWAASAVACPCGIGLKLMGGETGTVVRNSGFFGFESGVYFLDRSDALVEGCTVRSCDYGFYVCCFDDPLRSAEPDLGGGARGSMGRNMITDNYKCGLWNLTQRTIYARFNTWENSPPLEDVDFCNQGGGQVVWW